MDKYADLRALLSQQCNAVLIDDPGVLHALLAERDALREALETMVEMVEMNGFGRAYAMNVASAALAQGQEET